MTIFTTPSSVLKSCIRNKSERAFNDARSGYIDCSFYNNKNRDYTLTEYDKNILPNILVNMMHLLIQIDILSKVYDIVFVGCFSLYCQTLSYHFLQMRFRADIGKGRISCDVHSSNENNENWTTYKW